MALRIMPLGDSITVGFLQSITTGQETGYRRSEWKMLRAAGLDPQFVGSQTAGDTSWPDHDHQAVGGSEIYPTIHNGYTAWAAANPHDILQFIGGTPDLVNGASAEVVRDRMLAFLALVYSLTPSLPVIVGYAPQMTFTEAVDNQNKRYNELLPAALATRRAAGQRVSLVDTRVLPLADGVHPTAAGYEQIAMLWLRAILELPGVTPAARWRGI